jgi:endonuclease/exonuclease/phosphatase family metal-dependent hydrolase
VLTLELVRFSGPLLDVAYDQGGVTASALAAAGAYLAPAPVVALLLTASPRARLQPSSALVAGAALLAILRVVLQEVEAGARLPLGLAAVAVAVAVLTLAVASLAARPGGAPVAAAAVAAGAAAGVGLQLVLGTWDGLWRHNLLGWSVTVALVGALGWLTVLVARDHAPAPAVRVRGLWALGPFLALAAMMLANPAFAAAQSGVPLVLAGSVHALGLLLAGRSVGWGRPSHGRPVVGPAWRVVAGRSGALTGTLLVVLVAVALTVASSFGPTGAVVLVALLGAQLTAVRQLSRALVPASTPAAEGRAVWSPALPVAAGAVGLLTIVPLLAYQADYDLPLPFPNEVVLVATALALAVAGVRRSDTGRGADDPSSKLPTPLLAGCAVLVATGVAVAGAAWLTNREAATQTAGDPAAGSGRVLSWNVHYGVDAAGSVDLEAVARTIEAQRPDAVLLQEVSRGWVQGGGADMASWLSHRLGWQFTFAPAADRRFGNVILSPVPPEQVRITPLPYGAGPQQRSAVTARVPVGATTIDVTSVHLQNRRANGPTRMEQVRALLADLQDADRGRPAVMGGDFNATPGAPELALLSDAGWVSAVDVAGDPAALTSPSNNPTSRIDWVFGRGVAFREAVVLTDVLASDHLPLVVTVGP